MRAQVPGETGKLADTVRLQQPQLSLTCQLSVGYLATDITLQAITGHSQGKVTSRESTVSQYLGERDRERENHSGIPSDFIE